MLALLGKKAIAFRYFGNIGMRPYDTPSDSRQKSDPIGRSNQNFLFDALSFNCETIGQLLHHQETDLQAGRTNEIV